VLHIAFMVLCAGRLGCAPPVGEDPVFTERRERMVRDQLERRDIHDARVLAAMRAVARHLFVPASLRHVAYDDGPLPIGHGQTISQPYIVALMTELAHLEAGARVLEVGTGSGYQAAVLACLASEVYSVEIVEPLAGVAGERLRDLGYGNVTVRAGDGYRGWPEKGPFDAVLITAAPRRIPQPLLDQLAPGGRLVAPVGAWEQDLVVVMRTDTGFVERRIIPVRFVPMTGESERER